MRLRFSLLCTALLACSSLLAQTDGEVDASFQPVLRSRGQVTQLLAAPDGRFLLTGGIMHFQGQPVAGGVWASASGQFVSEFRRQPPAGFEDTPVAIFADGRVLALRSSTAPVDSRPAPRLVRLQASGATDPGFQSPALPQFWSALTLPNGKVLVRVRGSEGHPVAPQAIVRLGTDGTVDPTFVPPTWLGDSGRAMALQSDGKILIRASYRSGTGAGAVERQGVTRLLPDGALDPAFQLVSSERLPGGPADFFGLEFFQDSLLVLSDDRFYVTAESSLLLNGLPAKPALRFSALGNLDSAFSVANLTGGLGSLTALADGSLLGLTGVPNVNGGGLLTTLAVIRLTSQGALDTSFAGGAGQLALGESAGLLLLTPRPGGGAVVAGSFARVGGTVRSGLVAIENSGAVDQTFAAGTGVELDSAEVHSAAYEATGGGLWIGGTFASVSGQQRSALARLRGDGTLDPGFAPTVILLGAWDLQDDGAGGVFARVAIGTTGNTIRSGLAHFLADGSVDPAFQPPVGFSAFGPASSGVTVVSLVRQSDGRLLVGGNLPSPATGQNPQSRIVRLTAAGVVESGFDLLTGSPGRILLGPNGRIHAGAQAFRADGTLDTSFAIPPGSYPDVPAGHAVDASGRLLVADVARQPANAAEADAARAYGGLRRFLADGSVDATFRAPPRPFGTAHFEQFDTLLVQPDGRLLAAGTFLSFAGRDQNSLLRLTNTGTLDLSFSAGAGIFTGLPTLENAVAISGLIALPGGDVLIHGSFRTFAGQPRPGLARLKNASRAAVPASGAGRLVNLSTRAYVATGDQVMIAGFVLKGTGTRRLALRALGPSLTAFGVQNALQNPSFRVVDATGTTLASNDDWATGTPADLTNAGLAPTDARESGLVVNLGAGAYTVVVSGVNATSGVALVEVYDLDPAGSARLVNLSTRALTARPAGDGTFEPTIAGFAVRGGKVRTVLRGMGPSLAAAGVVAPLSDPNLTTRLFNGSLLAFQAGNDTQPLTGYTSAQLNALGLRPPRAEEAAIILDLPEGNYTAVLEGVGNPLVPGVALIEVYDQEDASLAPTP